MERRMKRERAELTCPSDIHATGHTHSSTSTLSTLLRIWRRNEALAEQGPAARIDATTDSSEAASTDDSEIGPPNRTETPPSLLSMIGRWGQQAVATVSAFSRKAASGIRPTSTKETMNATTTYSSNNSTPNSRSGWDRVERWEVANGRYEQFVEQQDAREYDIIDAREAESGSEGDDEVDDLGGGKWDKTLL